MRDQWENKWRKTNDWRGSESCAPVPWEPDKPRALAPVEGGPWWVDTLLSVARSAAVVAGLTGLMLFGAGLLALLAFMGGGMLYDGIEQLRQLLSGWGAA